MKGAARLTRALLLGGICLFLVSQTVDAEVKPASPFATTQNAPARPSAFAPPTAAPFRRRGRWGASSPGFSISSKACNARSPRASSRSRSTILSRVPLRLDFR